ncbi:MAG: glycosyltransferase family 4 protein [Ignavibacteriales bacterium]|nr:glycosyltransferase family 4 protein [Ignavibacteriales bacterium]
MKHRVLFFDHDSDITGSTISLMYILQELRSRGMEIWVASPKSEENFAVFARFGCLRYDFSSFLINSLGLDLHSSSKFSGSRLSRGLRLLKNFGKLILGIIMSAKAIWVIKPDLVYINEYVLIQSAISAWFMRIPCVVHIRSLIISKENIFRHLFIQYCLGIFPSHIIAITQSEAAQLKSRYLNTTRISVVTEFVEQKKYPIESDVTSFYQEHPQLLRKRIILFMGGIWQLKGTFEFLKAATMVARKHKDAHFVIIGRIVNSGTENDIQYYNDCSALLNIDESHSYISVLGHRTDVDIFLSQCSILVAPNQLDHFSRPIIEAWNFYKPVISTNLPHAAEIIINRTNGILTPNNRTDELAEAICELLANEKLSREIGKAGFEYASENFNLKVNLQKIFTIIQNVNYFD